MDRVDSPRTDAAAPAVASLMAELAARELTVAVAESLTGGLVTAELIRPPGASVVVLGGIVTYNTALKHSILGVDAALLEQHGPVHPEVARQMASSVRRVLAVDGRPADFGLSTTGVAGPDPQSGREPGTAFLGIAFGDSVEVVELSLDGSRDQIRARVVSEAVAALGERLRREPGRTE